MIEFQKVNRNINLPYQIITFVDIYWMYKYILTLNKVKKCNHLTMYWQYWIYLRSNAVHYVLLYYKLLLLNNIWIWIKLKQQFLKLIYLYGNFKHISEHYHWKILIINNKY